MRQANEDSPFGRLPHFMTTGVVTLRSQTPLHEVVRQVIDAHADRLVVLDEFDRPVGIVTAPDVLSAVAEGRLRDSGSGDPDDKGIDLAL